MSNIAKIELLNEARIYLKDGRVLEGTSMGIDENYKKEEVISFKPFTSEHACLYFKEDEIEKVEEI